MPDHLEDDLKATWDLRRNSDPRHAAFHLSITITSEFVHPTRDEARAALLQAFDEAVLPESDFHAEDLGD